MATGRCLSWYPRMEQLLLLQCDDEDGYQASLRLAADAAVGESELSEEFPLNPFVPAITAAAAAVMVVSDAVTAALAGVVAAGAVALQHWRWPPSVFRTWTSIGSEERLKETPYSVLQQEQQQLQRLLSLAKLKKTQKSHKR